MTYLITGGAGFIGSHFCKLVRHKAPDATIIIFDALTYAGNLKNIEDILAMPATHFVQGDIADAGAVEQLFAHYHPDVVVNFAAETHVDKSIHGASVDFVKTNILGTHTLLEAMRTFGLRKFIQISTDEVYGALPLDSHERFTETSPLFPRSPYAASKAGGDMLCRAYFETYGLPVVITRSSNNYGSHQFPEKMIPFWINELLAGRKIPLYGDGAHVRDWIHVSDTVTAIWTIVENAQSGTVWNIGVGNEHSNRSVAQQLLHTMGLSEAHMRMVADRPGHDRRYSLDAHALYTQLGFSPQYTAAKFSDGLRETVAWYTTHREWTAELEKKCGPFNAHIPPEPKEKIYIFGNGLLGSAYRKYFIRHHYSVVGERVDVRDTLAVHEVLQKEKPDVVLNCVAKTDIDWCENNKGEAIAVNTVGADTIASACATLGLYLVHISSGCIQQSASRDEAHLEDDSPTPVCFYSWTKVFAEMLIGYRVTRDGLKALVLRPRQLLSAELSPRNALLKMLTYTKFIDTDNSCTVIDDLLEATEKLIEKRATGVFNVVNDGVTSPYKIALALRQIIKPDMLVEKITKEELNAMTLAERIDTVLSTKKLGKEGINVPPLDVRLLHTIAALKRNLETEEGKIIATRTAHATKQKLELRVLTQGG